MKCWFSVKNPSSLRYEVEGPWPWKWVFNPWDFRIASSSVLLNREVYEKSSDYLNLRWRVQTKPMVVILMFTVGNLRLTIIEKVMYTSHFSEVWFRLLWFFTGRGTSSLHFSSDFFLLQAVRPPPAVSFAARPGHVGSVPISGWVPIHESTSFFQHLKAGCHFLLLQRNTLFAES